MTCSRTKAGIVTLLTLASFSVGPALAATPTAPPDLDAIYQERLRQLEQIRAARAEVQREILASELRLWVLTMQKKVQANWERPPLEQGASNCAASLQLLPSGDVASVTFDTPCTTESIQHSIESAILKSSPLPLPSSSDIFTPKIVMTFRLSE